MCGDNKPSSILSALSLHGTNHVNLHIDGLEGQKGRGKGSSTPKDSSNIIKMRFDGSGSLVLFGGS